MSDDEKLKRLEAAFYSGVLKVREGDTWVEYQSVSQMKIAIDDLKDKLSTTKPKGTRFVTFSSKGYY